MAIFQTIDQAREVQIGASDVILFDDIDPSDHQNLVHTSSCIWKNILQVSQLCQFRCRNKVATIPVKVPRVVTTNLDSLNQFVACVAGSNHTDRSATLLRLAHVRVEQSLYVGQARRPDAASQEPLRLSAAQADAALDAARAQDESAQFPG